MMAVAGGGSEALFFASFHLIHTFFHTRAVGVLRLVPRFMANLCGRSVARAPARGWNGTCSFHTRMRAA